MKPTIGRIVIIRQPSGEEIAGIITAVHTDTCVNISGFLPNGNVSGFSSVSHVDVAGAQNTGWDWPYIASAEKLAAAPLETYGGINLLGLLGGDFGAIAGPLLLMLYQSNKGRITTGADRIMTPPASAVDYVLDRLGIHGDAERTKVHQAVKAWGDKGGDILVALADAKAGG